jgi:hypothetical protein
VHAVLEEELLDVGQWRVRYESKGRPMEKQVSAARIRVPGASLQEPRSGLSLQPAASTDADVSIDATAGAGAGLGGLDIGAMHAQHKQHSAIKATLSEPDAAEEEANERTVAARAELTAITPTVERFFAAGGGDSSGSVTGTGTGTGTPEASPTAAASWLADVGGANEEELAALLSLAKRIAERDRLAEQLPPPQEEEEPSVRDDETPNKSGGGGGSSSTGKPVAMPNRSPNGSELHWG